VWNSDASDWEEQEGEEVYFVHMNGVLAPAGTRSGGGNCKGIQESL
jgi:hypothetical protein